MKELLVRTGNKDALQKTISALPGGLFLIGDVREPDGSWTIRAFPPTALKFLRFAIEKQGYAEVVGERDI